MKNHKRGLLMLLLLTSFYVITHAQTATILKIGTSRMENKQWYELGLGLGTFGSQEDGLGLSVGASAGVEFSKNEISPKLSLGTTFGAIGLTSSLHTNYYPQRKNFVFTPELGFSILKVLHITYGYQLGQIPESEGMERKENNNHRISFFFTVPLSIR